MSPDAPPRGLLVIAPLHPSLAPEGQAASAPAMAHAVFRAARARSAGLPGLVPHYLGAVPAGLPGFVRSSGTVLAGTDAGATACEGEAADETLMIVRRHDPATGLANGWILALKFREFLRAGGFDLVLVFAGAPVGIEFGAIVRSVLPAARIFEVLVPQSVPVAAPAEAAADTGEGAGPGRSAGDPAPAAAAVARPDLLARLVRGELARKADGVILLAGAELPADLAGAARVYRAGDPAECLEIALGVTPARGDGSTLPGPPGP